MTYLILKLFVYLALALVLGGAAGWLLRQFAVHQREEQLQRELADSRTKLPQLEALLRARDEQVRKLKQRRDETDPHSELLQTELDQLRGELQGKDNDLSRLKGELAEVRKALVRAEALVPAGDAAADRRESDAMVAALHKKLAEQKEQLAKQQKQLAAQRMQRELKANDQSQQREKEELSARLRQRVADQQRLQEQLEQEKRRVRELERERKLQASSLRVLHKQLELAREGATVNTGR